MLLNLFRVLLQPAALPWGAVAVVSLSMMGCGGGARSVASEDTADPAPAPPPTVGARLASLTAEARAEGVVEDVHGVAVPDPFRVLETMDADVTRRWVGAQSARTAADLADDLTEGQRERLAAWLSTGVVASPAIGGERVFYSRREGQQEQPVVVSRPLDPPAGEGDQTVVHVDPAAWGERAAVDWFYPSPGGRYLAFGISQNGDERSTLFLLDLESGERLDGDTIPRTKWCRLAWQHDDGGFYYTRYPAPGEPDHDPEQPESYHRRLFFHRIGQDPADDPLVFAPEDGRWSVAPSLSEDDRWLTVNVFHGWSSSDLHLLDRGRRGRRVDAPDDAHPMKPVFAGRESIAYGGVHRGSLYVLTNHEAPRWRVDVARRPGRAADDPERAFEVLVPESETPIEGWTVTRDRLVVEVIDQLASSLRVYDLRGRRQDDLALPARGSVSSLDGEATGSRLVFQHDGYLAPPSIQLASPARSPSARALEAVAIPAEADLDGFTTVVEHARSADGTEVPFTMIRPKTAAPRPRVLVTGYGGFNISLLPRFKREALYWVERGHFYVVANLRGGSEFGEEWHQAGNRERKERVFEDFEAVLRWFPAHDVTPAERIGITGRSNGGLLMGAAITRAPDAFGAAAAYVGLYDMVRFHRFPPAQLWTGEYGDPTEPDEFAWLFAYSPYHQVEDGTAYPAVLVEAAEADGRVHWAHSTKFAARLQEANVSDDPIYFYLQRQMGHGRGTRRSDLVEEHARMFAFLEQELAGEPGDDPPPASDGP